MAFSSSTILLLRLLFLSTILLLCRATHETGFKSIDLTHPTEDITLSPLSGSGDIPCDRVKICGLSRLQLGSFASSFRVTVVPSVVIPERLHTKIQVCFHWNESLGLCQCEDDEWKTIQKGLWSSTMSPYVDRYVDVKVIDGTSLSSPITVAVDEDFQQWRLWCLVMGFVLLLLAPSISSWVPFYYSSSMAIGVFLVILIILFQGMKMLPTGRKNVFYLTIYGSVLGAGSYIVHHFAMMVNSILLSFGMREEMHNPVAIFIIVGIVLSGAALGYWIVRKFVISKDGNVDIGVAQFVKWAMRIIAATSIFQSTSDPPLALGALACCWAICSFIHSLKWHGTVDQSYFKTGSPWLRQNKQMVGKRISTEFLSRSSPQDKNWKSSGSRRPAWSNTPVKGMVSPSSQMQNQDYYSTFHNTRNRKKFSKEAWDDFTRDSTRQALREWAASPEFADWIMEHADRIQLHPSEGSDASFGSESDSTDETVAGSGNRFGFLNW